MTTYIDFVEDIEHWYVCSVSLEHIDKLVDSNVFSQDNLGT
jgi:hypothetical protein